MTLTTCNPFQTNKRKNQFIYLYAERAFSKITLAELVLCHRLMSIIPIESGARVIDAEMLMSHQKPFYRNAKEEKKTRTRCA